MIKYLKLYFFAWRLGFKTILLHQTQLLYLQIALVRQVWRVPLEIYTIYIQYMYFPQQCSFKILQITAL